LWVRIISYIWTNSIILHYNIDYYNEIINEKKRII
jgi:hypothetical protein